MQREFERNSEVVIKEKMAASERLLSFCDYSGNSLTEIIYDPYSQPLLKVKTTQFVPKSASEEVRYNAKGVLGSFSVSFCAESDIKPNFSKMYVHDNLSELATLFDLGQRFFQGSLREDERSFQNFDTVAGRMYRGIYERYESLVRLIPEVSLPNHKREDFISHMGVITWHFLSREYPELRLGGGTMWRAVFETIIKTREEYYRRLQRAGDYAVRVIPDRKDSKRFRFAIGRFVDDHLDYKLSVSSGEKVTFGSMRYVFVRNSSSNVYFAYGSVFKKDAFDGEVLIRGSVDLAAILNCARAPKSANLSELFALVRP